MVLSFIFFELFQIKKDQSKPKLNPKTNKSQNLKSISSVQKLEKINKLKNKEDFKLNRFKNVESKLGSNRYKKQLNQQENEENIYNTANNYQNEGGEQGAAEGEN